MQKKADAAAADRAFATDTAAISLRQMPQRNGGVCSRHRGVGGSSDESLEVNLFAHTSGTGAVAHDLSSEFPPVDFNWFLGARAVTGAFLIIVLGTALTYIVIQFEETGKVIDGGFVGMFLSGIGPQLGA